MSEWKSVEGMSLLDYFAGQALAGFCALVDIDGIGTVNAKDAAWFVWFAYEVADKMLKERAK